jgi:hypothetical protein
MGMDKTLDAAIARRARAHHGVFTRSMARQVGFTDRQIGHRLASGRWVARNPEAITIAGVPPSFHQRLLVATLACPGAVASHESAAQLWAMVGVPRDRIVVTISRGGNHRIDGARVCESSDLLARDVRRIDGIDVTSRERTMCDLGRVLRESELRTTFNDQFHRGLVEIEGVYGVFYRYARPGRRGITRVRSVLDRHSPGFAVPESELEQRTIDLLDAAGIEQPQRQVRLDFWETVVGRVDFAYLDERIVIEVDGRLFHGPDVFESDRERDNAAGLSGWQVLRFTWAMVTQRPDYVVGTIATALRSARRLAS